MLKDNQYNVIELNKYGGKLASLKKELRDLTKGEILIKIHASTVHPSDLMFLIGEYGDNKPTKFPLIPGFEGCGEIVKVSEGISELMIGKRVAVTVPFKSDGSFDGLWAEYHYTYLSNCMIFDESVSYEKIAFAIINPMTAVGFLDTVKKHNKNSVVQDGASGALGKMFISLCAKEGVKTINLVRNQKYIDQLKKLGGDYVIGTYQSSWDKTMAKLANELNATVFFYCVGGNLPGKILSLLPNNSTLYNFGNLEIKKLGNDSTSLIFKNKKVEGWWLLNWLRGLKPDEKKKWFDYVAKDIQSGSEMFLSKISNHFDLKNVNEAIAHYSKNMSEGKILLKPKF